MGNHWVGALGVALVIATGVSARVPSLPRYASVMIRQPLTGAKHHEHLLNQLFYRDCCLMFPRLEGACSRAIQGPPPSTRMRHAVDARAGASVHAERGRGHGWNPDKAAGALYIMEAANASFPDTQTLVLSSVSPTTVFKSVVTLPFCLPVDQISGC